MLFKAKNLSWNKLTTAYVISVHAALALSLSGAALIDQLLPHGAGNGKNISPASSLLIITLGLYARPVGALIFGIRSDLKGYSRSIKECIPLLLISTALIGVLPESKWGVYSLAVLRAAQGFGFGGVYAIIGTYVYRKAPKEYQGQVTSLLQSSVYTGFLLMTLLLLLYKTSFSESLMNGEGWRFLFFLPLVWLLMFRIFVSLDSSDDGPSVPTSSLKTYLQDGLVEIRQRWKIILPDLLLISGLGALSFASANFKTYFLKVILMVPPITADVSIIMTALVAIPFYFLGGYVADRLNLFKVGIPLGLGSCILIPLCFRYIDMVAGHRLPMNNDLDIFTILKVSGALIAFTCWGAIAVGGLVKYTCDLFSERHRGLFFGFTYNFALSIAGGWVGLSESHPLMTEGGRYHGVDLLAEIGALAIFASIIAKLFFQRTKQIRSNN